MGKKNRSSYPGNPGYRNQAGRSGLDPVHSYKEAAFVEGTFYRKLFKLAVRTRKPFSLFLLLVAGASFAVPFWVMVFEYINFGSLDLVVVLILAIPGILGSFAVANFLVNIAIITRLIKDPYKKNLSKKTKKKKKSKK